MQSEQNLLSNGIYSLNIVPKIKNMQKGLYFVVFCIYWLKF